MVQTATCKAGMVFDEAKGVCRSPNDTPPPCGLGPSCLQKTDGRYVQMMVEMNSLVLEYFLPYTIFVNVPFLEYF